MIHDLHDPANPYPDPARVPHPRRVIDADGNVVPLTIRVDTVTGEVERYDYDAQTKRYAVGDDHRVRTIKEVRPAPLRFESLPGGMLPVPGVNV